MSFEYVALRTLLFVLFQRRVCYKRRLVSSLAAKDIWQVGNSELGSSLFSMASISTANRTRHSRPAIFAQENQDCASVPGNEHTALQTAGICLPDAVHA